MKTLLKYLALAAVAAGLAAGRAYAYPTLTLTDGIPADTVIISDGGLGDSNTAAGAITYVGSVGSNFYLTVETGLTKPALGSATDPQIDLNFVALSGSAGTLGIQFADSGFTRNGVLLNSIGGTTNGSVWDGVYVNGVLVTSIGPFSGPSYSGTAQTPVSLNAGDELLVKIMVTHGAGPHSSSGDNFVRVPDGGTTALLLGLGLLGVGFVARRFKSMKA